MAITLAIDIDLEALEVMVVVIVVIVVVVVDVALIAIVVVIILTPGELLVLVAGVAVAVVEAVRMPLVFLNVIAGVRRDADVVPVPLVAAAEELKFVEVAAEIELVGLLLVV